MLRLYPPRKGLSQNWRIRGTYLGQRVDQSSRTHRRQVAAAILNDIAAKIERKEWRAAPREEHFGETPWREIDQAAIDQAATILRPTASAATRNRCVYTPIAAILRFKDATFHIRRPPGAKGKSRTDYLNPPDAMAIIEAAETIDGDFARLLRFLLYSGARLGEVLSLDWADIHNATAYIRTSKNDDPRTVRLRDDLADDLESIRKPAGPVFPFRYGTALKVRLKRATCLASGVEWHRKDRRCSENFSVGSDGTVGAGASPSTIAISTTATGVGTASSSWIKSPPHRLRWVNFHVFRHTFATWFRQYGGGDIQGLVATGNWRDRKNAERYTHTHAHPEWARVERFPSMRKKEA